MLYIANFSYNDESDERDNYCLMPCVVEAADADAALEKLADHLRRAHEETDLLGGATEVYLDSLAELTGAPDEPVICQWQKIVPAEEGLCSITSALPLVDEDDESACAYNWGPVDEDGDGCECGCGCDDDCECGCKDGGECTCGDDCQCGDDCTCHDHDHDAEKDDDACECGDDCCCDGDDEDGWAEEPFLRF